MKNTRRRTRDSRNSMRKLVAEVKANAVCSDCGRDYPPHIMDFDHIRGEKEFNVSSYSEIPSMSSLKEEIKKCEVVCANCHRERTYQRMVKLGSDASSFIHGYYDQESTAIGGKPSC